MRADALSEKNKSISGSSYCLALCLEICCCWRELFLWPDNIYILPEKSHYVAWKYDGRTCTWHLGVRLYVASLTHVNTHTYICSTCCAHSHSKCEGEKKWQMNTYIIKYSSWLPCWRPNYQTNYSLNNVSLLRIHIHLSTFIGWNGLNVKRCILVKCGSNFGYSINNRIS